MSPLLILLSLFARWLLLDSWTTYVLPLVRQFGLSIMKDELFDCYESAKLPLYIPKRK